MTLPPAISGKHFNMTDADADTIKVQMTPLFSKLVPYLNELLNKVPKKRFLYHEGDLSGMAFNNKPRSYDGDCYTYNEGGMDEVQWNIGINPKRLRFGLGFHMDYHPAFRDGSNIAKVTKGLKTLKDLVRRNRSAFEHLVTNGLNGLLRLEVDFDEPRPGSDIVRFFEGNVEGHSWVSLGVHIPRVMECLKDQKSLDSILTETRDELWDYYSKALAGCYDEYKPKPVVIRRSSHLDLLKG